MPQKLPFKIRKGALVPASAWCQEQLKARKYSINDTVFATITKPRNPAFNRLVHGGFARLVVENIDAFGHLSPHDALKRIQIEADIGCDAIGINFPGVGPTTYRVPRSVSFESMSEEEFSGLFLAMCRYIARKYWPELSERQVAEMAEVMANE